ncbi:MAG: hypothetical protein GEU80_16090 [Dehalococcoidia bacterium]|nr:hypothetical protein [Dehalococcoidia bacterium]
MPADRAQLAQAVQDAFAGVPRPSADAIVSHVCDECWDLRDLLDGRTVEEVDDQVMFGAIWTLVPLSAEAKYYYLPAWLLRAVDDPRSDASSDLLFGLDSDHRWDPPGGYTPAQRAATVGYLRLMMDHADGTRSTRWIAPSAAGSRGAAAH